MMSGLFPEGVHTTPFDEPLYDVIALITRRGSELSPVMRPLVRLALDLLRAPQAP